MDYEDKSPPKDTTTSTTQIPLVTVKDDQEPPHTPQTQATETTESSMKNAANNVGHSTSVIQTESIPIYALPDKLKRKVSYNANHIGCQQIIIILTATVFFHVKPLQNTTEPQTTTEENTMESVKEEGSYNALKSNNVSSVVKYYNTLYSRYECTHINSIHS